MLKKAFVFPGQGSQYVGMGKKLCENYKTASDLFDEASDALSLDLKKMCFEGEQSELTLTYNAQPAILTTSVAMFRVCMEEEGIKPDLMAGHSLGEISALTAAGAIEFADAVKIVRKRGEFMQQAVPPELGSMVAVSTRDVEKLEAICRSVSASGGVVSISNYNSRTQTVVSGDRQAVDEVVKILEEEQIKASRLNVSAPFHCSLMQPAAEQFQQELANYTFHDLQYPVLSNVTAKPYQGKEDIVGNLTAQIVMPVRWVECMWYAKMAMMQYAVELGPGKVLKNMMKGIASDIPFYGYDNAADIETLKKRIKMSILPFLSRSMGISAATRNANWDAQAYRKGVIEPYNRISELQQLIEQEGREATREEMQQGIEMLLTMFETKKVPRDEQIVRFKELFQDSGTEELFQDFDYEAIK
ncbi:MAG TPA: ACP S-malonyltransferase [Bacilli bacterium]|nr:ACP S-malonyltransferase [Bacilli bacterium]